jgi:uncharacterized membrane protein
MSYNIHPIFVHFPVALLFVYSIIKILPFNKWFPKVSWIDIERALLLVGTLGAFAALATGDTAEHLTQPNRDLVEAHSTFAAIATWLYVSLLIGQISSFIADKVNLMAKIGNGGRKIVFLLKKIFGYGLFSKIIAFVALVAIMVTGLLGGVMVYGVTADPIAPMILSLLGISI